MEMLMSRYWLFLAHTEEILMLESLSYRGFPRPVMLGRTQTRDFFEL